MRERSPPCASRKSIATAPTMCGMGRLNWKMKVVTRRPRAVWWMSSAQATASTIEMAVETKAM